MARSLIFGNGRYLLNLDERCWIRDIYYPHIGIENHTEGYVFRLGVWVDGETHWTDQREWSISMGYEDGTLVGRTVLRNERIGLQLVLRDAVDFEVDVFCREITVTNLLPVHRDVRIFQHQDFNISGTEVGDTALFDPEIFSILHYKRDRYFMVGGGTAPEYKLSAFATGKKKIGGAEGTWRDAEDGSLGSNPIAQGSVDSTVALHVDLPAGGEAVTYYWLAAGERYGHVLKLNELLRRQGPESLIDRTAAYWRLWLKKHDLNFEGLSKELVRLYKTSLLVMRIHVDQSGAVIAATDSDITHFARDTYTYMWPRDGALVSEAFDRAGYAAISRRFFQFAGDLIKKEGYFLHKYNPDRSLASSWHPWVDASGEKILPIQEDETGLVVWALWEHFRRYRDVEEVQPLYRAFIIRAAEFLSDYRDPATGLPLPSWDLWEERRGVLTFTCAAVWAGLDAASRFAHAFGDVSLALHYGRAADEVRNGMSEHLWDEASGRFLRMLVPADSATGRAAVRDTAPDASLFGLHFLRVFDTDDPRVVSTIESVIQELAVRTPMGGLARYRGDYYHATTDDWERVPGNPWFLVQCWLASWRFSQAETIAELEEAARLLDWIAERALPSGLMPEQIHPITGEPLSVTPLVWSHAAFVAAIHDYIDSRNAFDACTVCGSPARARMERALR